MGDDWNIFFHRSPLTPDPSVRITSRSLVNAGIGREYWGAGIKKIPDGLAYRSSLKSIIRNLHLDEPKGRGAIFYGKFGSGKTASAAICLKSAMIRGGQSFLIKSLEIKHIHDKRWTAISPEGVEMWSMATRTQFVAIDDLGAEAMPEFGRGPDTRVVEELIRARYDERLPTYITTNLDLHSLAETYNSIKTILLDPAHYRIVEVSGKAWRQDRED